MKFSALLQVALFLGSLNSAAANSCVTKVHTVTEVAYATVYVDAAAIAVKTSSASSTLTTSSSSSSSSSSTKAPKSSSSSSSKPKTSSSFSSSSSKVTKPSSSSSSSSSKVTTTSSSSSSKVVTESSSSSSKVTTKSFSSSSKVTTKSSSTSSKITTTSPSSSSKATKTSSSSTAAASTSLSSFASTILAEHNVKRALHVDTPAMEWNKTIATIAQDYISTFKCGDGLKHSGVSGYGENLAYGYTAKGTVDAWYNEIKDYDFSDPGFSESTGHFTQVVWKASTQLGCGYIDCTDEGYGLYVSCNYHPQGNVIGYFSENVEKLKSS